MFIILNVYDLDILNIFLLTVITWSITGFTGYRDDVDVWETIYLWPELYSLE